MKEGDRVMLDKDFANHSEVILIYLGKIFSVVKDDDNNTLGGNDNPINKN